VRGRLPFRMRIRAFALPFTGAARALACCSLTRVLHKNPDDRLRTGCSGGLPGTPTRMGHPRRPSNVWPYSNGQVELTQLHDTQVSGVYAASVLCDRGLPAVLSHPRPK